MFVPVCALCMCFCICNSVLKMLWEENRKLFRKNITYKRKYESPTWETIQICLKYKTCWEYCVKIKLNHCPHGPRSRKYKYCICKVDLGWCLSECGVGAGEINTVHH